MYYMWSRDATVPCIKKQILFLRFWIPTVTSLPRNEMSRIETPFTSFDPDVGIGKSKTCVRRFISYLVSGFRIDLLLGRNCTLKTGVILSIVRNSTLVNVLGEAILANQFPQTPFFLSFFSTAMVGSHCFNGSSCSSIFLLTFKELFSKCRVGFTKSPNLLTGAIGKPHESSLNMYQRATFV